MLTDDGGVVADGRTSDALGRSLLSRSRPARSSGRAGESVGSAVVSESRAPLPKYCPDVPLGRPERPQNWSNVTAFPTGLTRILETEHLFPKEKLPSVG